MHTVFPTPTQYALAACFLVLGPAIGIAAARVQGARGRNMAWGLILGSGAAWTGWFVSCIVAIVLFPTYPRGGVPPEPVALFFVVPGFFTGGAVLWWLATRLPIVKGDAAAERRRLRNIAVGGLIASAAFVVLHREANTRSARRHLPREAVILDERAYEDISDFRYTLRARMSENDFRAWAEELELTRHADRPERYGDLNHDGECGSFATYAGGVGEYESWCR